MLVFNIITFSGNSPINLFTQPHSFIAIKQKQNKTPIEFVNKAL